MLYMRLSYFFYVKMLYFVLLVIITLWKGVMHNFVTYVVTLLFSQNHPKYYPRFLFLGLILLERQPMTIILSVNYPKYKLVLEHPKYYARLFLP